jgi:PRTRC genetic system ThiF family protein
LETLKWLPPAALLQRAIRVLVIGAGGTGSQVCQGLAPLHMALCALGHPSGLDVEVMDPSKVREANLGRQPFYPSDVGQPKAVVLASRVNAQYSCMSFTMNAAVTEDISKTVARFRPDIIVGCVDTKAGRKAIAAQIERYPHSIWLDTGNRADDGQVVMGNGRKAEFHVPTVADLFPEIIDTSTPDDNSPSCSMQEALHRQSLYINREISLQALDLLSRFLRGGLTHHARLINLAAGRMNSIPVSYDVWARMGYEHPRTKKRARKQRK